MEEKIIEQMMQLSYLGTTITSLTDELVGNHKEACSMEKQICIQRE